MKPNEKVRGFDPAAMRNMDKKRINEIMSAAIPEDAADIIQKLEEAGYEAYAVGGCVRDSLLGRIPGDWDLTTSAKPEEVKTIFGRTVDTGIAHGTVTIMMHKVGYEVTTYRIDGEYEDDRHPKEVSFTADLKKDLERRDFTINAMAWHPERGLVDLFGGMDDLEQKVVRAVGDPGERFDEDALRILRAFRFSAQLGFTVEETTAKAAGERSEHLRSISKERIESELNKLILSDHPEEFRKLYEYGITKVIMPEFDRMIDTPQNSPYHHLNVGDHTIEVMKAIRPERCLRWAALMHDMGKPDTKTTDENGFDHFYGHRYRSGEIAEKIMMDLKMDRNTIDRVKRIVHWHDYRVKLDLRSVRRAFSKMGPDLIPDFLAIMEADAKGKNPARVPEFLQYVSDLRALCEEVERSNSCVTLKQLAVHGGDLIAAGIAPGPEMGEILFQLLLEVLDDPEKNEKDYLLCRAKEMAGDEVIAPE